MINIVPMSTDAANPNAAADPLVQAMMAQRQQRQSQGQRMMEAGSRPQPVFNTAQGMMMLANGALGGFLEGRDERNQRAAQQQAGMAIGQLGKQAGLSDEQTRALTALAIVNPGAVAPMIAQMSQRMFNPPATFSQERGPDGGLLQRNNRTGEMSSVQPGGGWTIRQTGVNAIGNPIYEEYNERTGERRAINRGAQQPPAAAPAAPGPIQDPRGPTAQPQGSPQAGGPSPAGDAARRAALTAEGYPVDAPLPPVGVNPRTFFEEWSKRQTAGTMPAEGDTVSALRKEVMQSPAIKKVNESVPIFNSMVESARQNNRAADIDFAYGIAKLFDPESVVREGEMLMVRQTGSIPEQVFGKIQGIINGSATLTPGQRADLLSVGFTRVRQYMENAGGEIERYRGVAERNRANPDDVLPRLPQPNVGGFEDYVSGVAQQGGIMQQLRGAITGGPATPPMSAPVPEPRPAEAMPQMAPQGMPQGAPMPQEAPAIPQGLTLEMLDAAIAERQRQMQMQQQPNQMNLGGMGIP